MPAALGRGIAIPDMNSHDSISRLKALLGAGIGSAAAGILVPTAVITGFAAMGADPARVTHFAMQVAEPLALLGAAAVTAFVAAWTTRSAPRGRGWGAIVGGAAAGCVAAAAWWIGDVDRWTALAAALLPIVGVASAHLASRARPSLATARTNSLPAPGRTFASSRSRCHAPESD